MLLADPGGMKTARRSIPPAASRSRFWMSKRWCRAGSNPQCRAHSVKRRLIVRALSSACRLCKRAWRCSEESDGVSEFVIGEFRDCAKTDMLVPLSRLAPAAIKHCDCRTDFSGRCGCWIIERANKRLQRLCGVVARPQRKRAEVARQRPTYRFPPWGTFLCACSWTSTAARQF